MDASGTSGTILVVEDDPEVAGLLIRVLERDGFAVRWARTGTEAVLAVTGAPESPALLLLDVNLPDVGGFEVLARIRHDAATPVILVSGRGRLDDRVQGLELGADDYVVKPFAGRELVARVRSVLRRGASGPARSVIRHGRLAIDTAARTVSVDAAAVPLTRREHDLLAFLAASPGRAFSRQELLEHVWGSSEQWQDPATVTEHVRRLRAKIEADPERPCWITTVRGAGYRFDHGGDGEPTGPGEAVLWPAGPDRRPPSAGDEPSDRWPGGSGPGPGGPGGARAVPHHRRGDGSV